MIIIYITILLVFAFFKITLIHKSNQRHESSGINPSLNEYVLFMLIVLVEMTAFIKIIQYFSS